MTSNRPEILEILLVEDEKIHQLMAKKFLAHTPLDYHLETVVNEKTALDFLYRRAPYTSVLRPDVILLDLDLPKLGGIEFVNKIKLDPDLKNISIIVLNDSDRDPYPAELARHPGVYCFTKWTGTQEFLSLIKTVQTHRALFLKKVV